MAGAHFPARDRSFKRRPFHRSRHPCLEARGRSRCGTRSLMTPNLRRLSPIDLSRLRQFLIEHWGGEEMITRGTIYRPEQVDGFVIEDQNEWVGLRSEE